MTKNHRNGGERSALKCQIELQLVSRLFILFFPNKMGKKCTQVMQSKAECKKKKVDFYITRFGKSSQIILHETLP